MTLDGILHFYKMESFFNWCECISSCYKGSWDTCSAISMPSIRDVKYRTSGIKIGERAGLRISASFPMNLFPGYSY